MARIQWYLTTQPGTYLRYTHLLVQVPLPMDFMTDLILIDHCEEQILSALLKDFHQTVEVTVGQ